MNDKERPGMYRTPGEAARRLGPVAAVGIIIWAGLIYLVGLGAGWW